MSIQASPTELGASVTIENLSVAIVYLGGSAAVGARDLVLTRDGMTYDGSGKATLGPGLLFGASGGLSAVGSGDVSLVGTATRPTVFRGSGVYGVRSVSGNVIFQGPSYHAIDQGKDVSGVSVLGGGNGIDAAIVASGTLSNIQVSNFQGDAISCVGCTITGGVTVSGTLLGSAVRVPSGSASITGLHATMNQGDGIRCEGTSSLKLRNSILDGNARNGLLALGQLRRRPRHHVGSGRQRLQPDQREERLVRAVSAANRHGRGQHVVERVQLRVWWHRLPAWDAHDHHGDDLQGRGHHHRGRSFPVGHGLYLL